MKNRIKILAVSIAVFSQAFGFIGFGLNVNQDIVKVDPYSESSSNLISTVQLTRTGFDNAYGLGGYLSLDFIPIVDLEIEGQATGNVYTFDFSNFTAINPDEPVYTTGDVDFAWARASAYVTVRKKILGLGLPLIGGVKVHIGGGLNSHYSAPFISLDTMKDLLGDALYEGFEKDAMQDKVIKYIEDNSVQSTGFHFMAGLQFKLLVLDSWVFYRYTMAPDIYSGQEGFGTLNLRLGLGF